MEEAIHERVTKEKIPQLHFVSVPMITDESELKRIKHNLELATDMCQSFYTKTRIIFETREGTKEVLTTIWAATDNHILLKGGISIPMNCVRNVIVS